MNLINTEQFPQYLIDDVSVVSAVGNGCRMTLSDTADYDLPRTRTKYGEWFPPLQSVSWSLTSLFSTNMAISETKGQGWKGIRTQ